MKIRQSLKENGRHWLFMFILLCLSGNPLFSFETNYTIFAFFISFILDLFLIRGKGIIKIITYGFPFFFVWLLQAIIIPDFQITSTGYMVMKFCIGVIFVCLLKEDFSNAYIDVMFFLCICSIIGFLLTLYYGILPGIPCANEGNSQILYTQLIVDTILIRNSGMFWEPGAFASYINLGLLLFILNERTDLKTLIPFIIALFTTLSTTGYIVFFVLLFFYISRKRTIHPILKIIFAIAVVAVFAYLYTNLSFMGDKINGSQGSSSNSRITDYSNNLQIIFDNLLLGVSYIDEGVHTGNGFLSFLSEVGIVVFLYYFILLKQKIKFYTGEKSLFPIFIIIIILQGECFLNYPLFLALPCVYFVNSLNPNRT